MRGTDVAPCTGIGTDLSPTGVISTLPVLQGGQHLGVLPQSRGYVPPVNMLLVGFPKKAAGSNRHWLPRSSKMAHVPGLLSFFLSQQSWSLNITLASDDHDVLWKETGSSHSLTARMWWMISVGTQEESKIHNEASLQKLHQQWMEF